MDGKLIQSKKDFAAKIADESIFQIGKCSVDFGGNFEGDISNVRHWKRALNDKESLLAVSKRVDETNTPDFNWKPISESNNPANNQTQSTVIDGFVADIAKINVNNENIKISNVEISNLGDADHSQIVKSWDHNSLDRGARIYNGLCITCHGTDKVEGTLPTALRFHEGQFKNGKDPLSMYLLSLIHI